MYILRCSGVFLLKSVQNANQAFILIVALHEFSLSDNSCNETVINSHFTILNVYQNLVHNIGYLLAN
jgi:hypothetical protein